MENEKEKTDLKDLEVENESEFLLENQDIKLENLPKYEDLIKIIKTTYFKNSERLNNGKKVTDKDLSFFNQAEKHLYTELGYSLNMTYDECKNYIIKKISSKIKGNDQDER